MVFQEEMGIDLKKIFTTEAQRAQRRKNFLIPAKQRNVEKCRVRSRNHAFRVIERLLDSRVRGNDKETDKGHFLTYFEIQYLVFSLCPLCLCGETLLAGGER